MNAPSMTPASGYLGHLLELRRRLLHCVLAVGLLFSALIGFANPLYQFIAAPLLRHLPQHSSMIATEVITPFFTPMKLTLMLAIVLAIPYLLHQLWRFVAPGLYRHERRLVLPLVASSALLFYLGMAFAYLLVMPLLFGFITATVPEGVQMATDIASYLDFVLTLFLAFGLAFEIPVATVLLCWSGLCTPQGLARQRPYVLIGVFVIGMLLTPPDVFSQTLLAIPMWLLFELGLLVSRYARRPSGVASTTQPDAAG